MLGYLGVRATTKSARRTAEAAASSAALLEKNKVDAQAYERARDSYEAALAVTNQRIVSMQENIDRLRAERRADSDEAAAEARDLRHRIDELEAHEIRQRNVLRVIQDHNLRLIVYARMVYAVLQNASVASLLTAQNIRVPSPPRGVADTDPDVLGLSDGDARIPRPDSAS